MGSIWSEKHKLETWQRVEALALEAWEQLGDVPEGIAGKVAEAPCPTPQEVAERERVTNHDLAAFVDLLGERSGEEAASWVHFGLTSSDVLDTAGGALLRDSADLLVAALARLLETVREM